MTPDSVTAKMGGRSFQELQEGLASWDFQAEAGGTILAVPSLTLPYFGTPVGRQLMHYEERIFYLIHFLKNPRNRLIVVTSTAVAESLVSYLLHLLPGVPYSHARRRLTLFSLQDHSDRPLTQKILERPPLLSRLRLCLQGQPRAALSCYTVTDLEERLAEELQIPVYGPRAEHLKLATKSIARNIFRDLDLTCAVGAEHLTSLQDVAQALVGLLEKRRDLDTAVLKHNYSLSGLGNALVDLAPLRRRMAQGLEITDDILEEIAGELPRWVQLGQTERDWSSYWQRFQEGGGVLEEYVDGDSCSVQVRIGRDGAVDVIATHDEISGGEDGQTYVGCRLPAQSRVTAKLAEAGCKVGARLAELGVVGRFDVDFLATPAGGTSLQELYAIDVNLRKGNTTLPIRTLQLLSSGSYNAQEGVFRSGLAGGEERCYLSSDNFGAGRFVGLLPRDLLEIISSAGLHYSSATQTGALFHMLSAMSERGSVGITAIGRSHDEAEQIYQTVLRTLDEQRDGHDWMT